jgi:predicted nucleic acid-binding protein
VMRYVLDTTFIVDHLRGDPVTSDRLARIVELGDEPFVTDVIVAESWAGAHSDDDPDLEALLRFIEFVQPGPLQAKRAGRFRAEARRRGWTLSTADALIAASAESLEAVILTRNLRDFALTPTPVEDY